jgi:hypothetical protein
MHWYDGPAAQALFLLFQILVFPIVVGIACGILWLIGTAFQAIDRVRSRHDERKR